MVKNSTMSNIEQLSEPDELCRQVVDLSRELAERERVSCEQQRPLDPEILGLGKEAVLRDIISSSFGRSDLFSAHDSAVLMRRRPMRTRGFNPAMEQ